jgi:hypothetical protein
MIRGISFRLKIVINAILLGYTGWFFFLLFKDLSRPYSLKNLFGLLVLGFAGFFLFSKVLNEVWFVRYDELNEIIYFKKIFRNLTIKVKDIVEIQVGKTLRYRLIYFTFRTSNSSFQVNDMENLADFIRVIRKSNPKIHVIDPYDIGI